MAGKVKKSAAALAARRRAMARALELNAERLQRERELTDLAADFLETRELEGDVVAELEAQIAQLRAEAAERCEGLRREGAQVVAAMVGRNEGVGRIARRLGVGVGEVRELRDAAAGAREREGVRGRPVVDRVGEGGGVRAVGVADRVGFVGPVDGSGAGGGGVLGGGAAAGGDGVWA
ncbi:hypothetical protein ACH4VR_29680 [Streptomyces sp. NPDC020883]|uniref:hypothetical protein n=1 Tax=Streptomyces sp. NPDC020883 TaxID=3365099 RepID=UPI0037993544